MSKKKSVPDLELESPIPFHFGSNGEFMPRPPGEAAKRAEELFWRVADECSRKLGIDRRDFIQSASGMAAALLVINTVAGRGRPRAGSGYNVSAAMTLDEDAACEGLKGSEFIFDVQTHHVNPMGAWREQAGIWERFFGSLPHAACGEIDKIDCFDVKSYIDEVFVKSDTTMAVLSAVPADVGTNPLEVEEAAATREIMNQMADSQRLVIHGLVLPELGQPELERMQYLAEEHKVAAWKVYTPFRNWRLDDAVGIPFLERARELGVTRVCAHKGLAVGGLDPTYASPQDVGPAARRFPDIQFLIYHSAFEFGDAEGPYNADRPRGVDRLIRTLQDHNIGPNANVYAELGSTWRAVMTDPTAAAHVVGKLLKYVGEDRVIWGTDSIWYGTPQDQIQAFRAFQIPEELQEAYGYPALTPEVKAKVFGLSSAEAYGIDVDDLICEVDNDEIAKAKTRARLEPSPCFRHYGPRTRREFVTFLRQRDGRPG